MIWLALLAALGPSWVYLGGRYLDGSDEPVGAVATLILAALCLQQPPARLRIVPLALGLALYLATLWTAGGLVAAGVAVTLLVVLWHAGSVSPGRLGLAWLALPSLASLHFYLGYPARVVAAEGGRGLLGLAGLGCRREGVSLLLGEHRVLVDGPCSGLSGLWVAALVVCLLAEQRRWRWSETLRASLLGLLLVTAGNAWRVSSLVMLAALPAAPTWAHAGLGLITYAVTLAGLIWWSPAPLTAVAEVATPVRAWRAPATVWVLVLAAGLLARGVTPETSTVASGPWPESFRGQPLGKARPASAPEGIRAAYFRQGKRLILVRCLSRPSRLLHSSRDCQRGLGYTIRPGMQQGRPGWWAERDGRRLWNEEVVIDADGQEFTDLSQWYWAAELGRSRGPWTAYTVCVTGAAAGSGRI